MTALKPTIYEVRNLPSRYVRNDLGDTNLRIIKLFSKNLFDSLENVDYNLKIDFTKPLNGFLRE
jgi:hypothetical protein